MPSNPQIPVTILDSTGATKNANTVPAVGVAGTPSADVASVQGVSGGTPIPVSGTVAVTGVATAANQATEISSLASIATNTTGVATNAGITGASSKTLTDVVNALAGVPAGLGQKTMANSQAVTLASDQSAIPVTNASLPLPAGAATAAKQPALGTAGVPSADVISTQGIGYDGTATVTRAANTTVYSVGDVVGGALTIANVGPATGKIFITDVMLLQNLTAVPVGQTSFRLYLYNVTPPSAIADNSPFTMGSGDRASFLGYIDIGSPALLGVGTGTPETQVSQVNMRLTTASTSLFGYLVTNGGFTPAANSETYTLGVKSIGI